MNKITSTLQTIFVSLSHALALASLVYVAVMGTLNFTTLTSVQVSYLQSLLVGLGPFLAIKISDFVRDLRNGGQQ